MSVKSYFRKKMLIDFILVNLIINAIFFFVNFRNPSAILTIELITEDLLMGLILLGALASIANLINLKKDMLKGVVDLDNYSPHIVHKLFPKSLILRAIILVLMVVTIVFPWFSPVPSILGVSSISYLMGFLIKTISAVVAAIMVGYIVINLILSDHRSLCI